MKVIRKLLSKFFWIFSLILLNLVYPLTSLHCEVVDLSAGTLFGSLTVENGVLKNPRGIMTSPYMGFAHGFVLATDGTVWGWGWNYYGNLGIGTYYDTYYSPVQVKGPNGEGYLSDIIKISANGGSVYALRSDGTVWAWGSNSSGALGQGYASTRITTPVQVKGPDGEGYLNNIVDIAAGFGFCLALKSDGTVWAWGNNYYGQLGIGSWGSNSYFPVQVKGPGGEGFLTNIVAISASALDYSLAIRSDGTVWAWGCNENGTLGIGYTSSRETTPVQVKGPGGVGYLSNVVAVSAGDYHVLALKSDGTVWAWGNNSWGQLGDGSGETQTTPVQVKGANGEGNLSGITKIIAASGNSFALKSDGSVWSWGYNDSELGDGTLNNREFPVKVVGSGGVGYLTDVVDIGGGYVHHVALKSDNTLWGWGWNEDGQLLKDPETLEYTTTPINMDVFGGYAVYSINRGNKSIKDISITSNNKNYLGFLFSSDGFLWKKWNGSEWIGVPGLSNTVLGNSETEVEALGKTNWDNLLGSNETLYIAVILRGQGQVSSIEVNYDNGTAYNFPSFSIKSSGSLSGKAPHTVVLSADAEDLFEIIKQYDPDFSYEWDFGDGSNKVTGKRVVGHTYKVAGTYTVTLDVWDKYSNHSQHTAQVVVSQPEDLTVRHFKVYYSNPYQRVPLKVILRPVLEYLPGLERVVSNQWSVGLTPVAQNKSQVVLAFNSAGDYQVNFSGTTNYGRSVLGQFALTVNPNQLPSCTMEYQDYPSQGYTKFTPSCVDPDGRVVSYYWEFGNGEVSKSRVGYAHYSQGGSYDVKLTVKDSSGESRTFSWNVSVTR